MVDKDTVVKLVEERLGEQYFLVDLSISNNNSIRILVDGVEGITIEKCVEISRNVEHNLNRDDEDFDLQVSSPGLSESFKVIQQYYKYKDREVEIVTSDDITRIGKLKEVGDEMVVLETSSREKVEGHKKKQLIVREYKLKYSEIKSAKAVISFK